MSRFKVQSPKKHIDLSHKIHDGLITYKGLPAPLICDYISRSESREIYGNQAEFQISTINMVSNTGTYLDCPFHRFGDGDDLSQLELDKLVNLEAILIRVPYTKTKEITKDFFYGYELKDKAVLVQTDWDDFWNTEEYYQNNPYLTADAATYLKDCSIKLLGIDSLNVEMIHMPAYHSNICRNLVWYFFVPDDRNCFWLNK